MIIRRTFKNKERGQVLILCAVCMVVLLLFVGLAIDFGMAYVTKARLGKAADAAALSGAKSLYLGQDAATLVAQSAFAMNYGLSTPTATAVVTYSPDGTHINVQGNATNHPFFLPLINLILPQTPSAFESLPVGASAQATRAHVIMTLVLDTSGSMQGNGGWSALPPAVNSFISHFDDNLDSVAVVTFASTVTLPVPVPMITGNFKSAVQSLTAGMDKNSFNGATFSDGGLRQAIVENSKPTLPGNIVKVVVFFTDGHANTIHQTLDCATANVPSGTWNVGGYDGGDAVGFMDPNGPPQELPFFTEYSTTSSCDVNFPSLKTGGPQPITFSNISSVGAEAEYRAVADSNVMRAAPNKMIVYSIGLGNAINKPFLYQIANDPLSSTYNDTLPIGEADFAPTAVELQAIFDKLAYKILLRLTQ